MPARKNIFDLRYQSDKEGNEILCTTDGAPFTGIVEDSLPGSYVATEYEVKNGLKDGVEKEFYADGSVECITHYRCGLYHGDIVYYDADGLIKEKSVFEYGILMETFLWDEQGMLLLHELLPAEDAKFQKVMRLRSQYAW